MATLNEEKPLIAVHRAEPAPGCFSQLSEILRRFKGTETRFFSKWEEGFSTLGNAPCGIVVFCLNTKEEIAPLLNYLQSTLPQIQQGLLHVLVFNAVFHDRLQILLKQNGAREVLSYSLNSRALTNKIIEGLDSIEAILRRAKRFGKAAAAPAKDLAEALAQASNVVVKPPLNHSSDCWTTDGENPPKCISNRWLIEMTGPGPSIGTWKKAADSSEWEWCLRKTTDLRYQGGQQGTWIFSGRKPDFDWEKNRWRFVSETPLLAFRLPDGSLIYRFRMISETTLEITENSPTAKEKSEIIVATFTASKKMRITAEVEGGRLVDARTPKITQKGTVIAQPKELSPEKLVLISPKQKAESKSIPAKETISPAEAPPEEIDDSINKAHTFWKTGVSAFDAFEVKVTLKHPQIKKELELLGFDHHAMTLGLDSHPIDSSAPLELHVESRGDNQRQEIRFEAKIRSVVNYGDDYQVIEIDIPQQHQAKAKEIKQSLEKRQVQALRFFREAKGY